MASRSQFLAAVGLICAGVLVSGQSQNFDGVRMKVTPVKGSVSMITGRGGNIGLSVGADGVLMIDDQFAPLSDKLEAVIAEVAGRPVDLLINTHWHGDHTGGNQAFGEAGAVILAHDNVRKRLVARHFPEQADRFVSAPALPVVTFDQGLTLHFNGEEIRLIKTPAGHTDGDAIVHFTGSDVIHMGDVFFNGLYSYFDSASGGSFDGLIAGLELGLALAGPDTRIVPGHGALATRSELADHTGRMIEIRRRVQEAIDSGLSKADFIAGRPTADLEAAYRGRYQVMPAERFLGLVYDDLSG